MTTSRLVYFPDPVPDRPNLYDRTPALTDVLDSLRYRTTVIRGGRLIGKTSLLNVVGQLTDQQGEFALIRLAPTDSRVAFMAEILDGIHHWVDRHLGDSSSMPEEKPIRTIAQFRQRIATLAEQATGVVFLLCVDEFDSLIQNLDNHEARLVLELIVHLDTMPNLPVRFLLTLSAIPDLVTRSFSSPILNQAKIVRLEPWGADEAGRFAEWLVDDRFIFDEAALAALFAAAGGHPYFTKAVVSALLSGSPYAPGSRYVSAERVCDAVRQVARSPEVDLALANLVGAHLSADAATVLDRAGASPAGITGWGLGDLSAAEEALTSLQADGLLWQQGDRYLLRLGLWREWRAANRGLPGRPPLLYRIGRAARRVHLGRAKAYILLTAVAGSLLTVLLTAAYLTAQRTIVLRPCAASTANLVIDATYPVFASAGDMQQIHLVITNNGQTDVNGSTLLSFPASQVRLDSPNWITFTQLRPGEEATQDVNFTTTAGNGWLSLSRAPVGVELAISVGSACRPQRWSIGAAPIPHLQLVQKVAETLLAAFLIPIVVGLVAGWFSRGGHGSRAGAAPTKGS